MKFTVKTNPYGAETSGLHKGDTPLKQSAKSSIKVRVKDSERVLSEALNYLF